jgi:hypothetical protein
MWVDKSVSGEILSCGRQDGQVEEWTAIVILWLAIGEILETFIAESGESMSWSVVSMVSSAIACMRLFSLGCIHKLQGCKHGKHGKDDHMMTDPLRSPSSTSSKQSQTHRDPFSPFRPD